MWDNPRGQLPGTGIRSDAENLYRGNLYGGSAQGTSSGSVAVAGESSFGGRSLPVNVLGSGSGGASSGGHIERPSLFSDSGNSLPVFNPFAAAMASLGPVERYESQYMGASEFLNRRVNEELQRAFEAGIPSSEVYPSAEIYHIGTPSERPTSEGFRSAVSHGTSSVPSHPTSSPVSFGPSTPVQSASAAPARLLSSPGGMSDVAGTLTPPGLPLRDPPRVAASYGIPLNDPVFGISSGSLPCENPGQRPIPPPAPPQPAGSAGSAGVQDPYAQIMQSQSAMSMLMMQMAREMNQRSLQHQLPQQQQQQVGQDPNQPQAAGQQGGQTGGYQKEMKMDEKWIPAMPVPGWKSWTSRGKELSGFKDWLEKFSGWLSLIHDAYGPELWETIHADYPIQPCRTPEQVMRSKRLFHILQQQFVGYSKIENLIRSRISATGITESNGFELLRLIRKEFSLMSRTEALSYREMCLKFRVKRTEHLLDIIREVESEIESFHAMLDASVIVHQLGDVRISEGDQFLLYLRNLPSKVQEFLQVHRNAVTVQQLKTGVQDYYIRTRVQGDLGSVHVAQPVAAKADLKDKTCFNCGKKGHLAENCPEPKKCSHCGRKGHLAKDCWEKHPEKKPAAKPKAKSQPTKPGGRGKGRGKGGRKTKGRGRGNKFRNVEGENEDEEQDEDYEDDGEPEGDDEEHPEPEGEDPSGSVNQINQMTMCVRGKPVTVAASSSSTERVGSEQHRVDEINLSEKFQSIGVGDPKRRWLVDSGATCHIISERWLSHYKVVYKYEVGIPVLKGAGDNVLPTRGMVDLECKIGKIKVIMRKVVICALDLNVLSSYSLHEQGWETRLGTLKVSGLYHKKVKFPLKISDRAWWLEVLVLKHQGKSSRRKGNGPQDMEIDHVGTVQSCLSSKACQTKAVVTEVSSEHKKPVETLEGKRETSCIPHVSSAENVGHFKNMRRECQVKSFEGLGPFSYVCRMMRFSEPNTNEFEPEEGSVYSERCVGDQHYVCVVNPDHQDPERVRGFPVEIDVEEGEHDAGENIFGDDDSGYVPTTPPKSDQGSDREPASKRPRDVAEEKVAPGPGDPNDPDDPDGEDSDDPAQRNIPELEGNLLFQHESRGHWPYDRGCDACVQARGRTPARRRKQKAEESGQTAEFQLAADYTFIAGRHWRLLVMLMIHTGMLGIVVVTGNRENDVKSVSSVLNEIGVGGLNIEIATDNEPYLIDLVEKNLRKSNARAYHWRNISEYRPQAKGVERAVGIAKEGIYTNWLAFEQHCQCRIALESPLLGYLVGYVYRTFDVFCDQKRSGTPLERLRDSRGGQKPSSFPFGMIGFSKPVLLAPWKGQRLVLCVYLGMRYVTGGGVLVFPVNPDSLGNREVIRGHSFRIREGVQFDVQTVWPLLAGVIPNDPSVAPPFVDPRESLENPVPEGVLEDDIPVFPSPSPVDPHPVAEPSAPSAAAAPPSVAAPADDTMDVDLRGDDDDFPMEELGCIEDHCIHWYHQSVWNEFASIESCMEVGSTNTTFTEKFGGIDIKVEVPSEVNDELTGLALDHSQVVEGMKTEVRQLESLKVGKNMTESEARKLAKEKGVKILTSRWVNTQKTPTLARCRLVVRDFASGAESAFRSGIYAPTSSLDSLRCVLALASLWDLWLITSDVSTAFMYAEVEEDACDLVLLPSNISFKGERVVCLLFKAMNGLRRAPLLWFYHLQRTIYTLGGEDTFESTLFRIPTKRGVILLLVYVDDLLIASQDQQEGENLLKKLMEIWKMKITGRINCQKKGALQFLGRSIYRAQDGESSLYFGVSREYMVGIFESWGENIKTGHVGLMPKLEDVHKEFVKKFGEEPLTEKGIQRYHRVLGQLAWAALSRADLSFPISFLSRFQAKPNPAAEHCMRVFMKWLSGNLHFVQSMPAPQCPHAGESKEIVSFCDASWGLDSVSGAIFVYRGCCIKFFSRKQEVPALSSAEAEIISIVDTAKEMVSLGMLLQTMIQGIPLDPLGMPLQTTGEMGLTMFNDAKAAISMGKMDGLLRPVRHLELRVKYCQHLYRRRQLSLTHWRGDENPADGLTKSLRPLNLWTNLVDAVGLVPGPNEKGQNWIKNFLNQIKQGRAIQEGE